MQADVREVRGGAGADRVESVAVRHFRLMTVISRKMYFCTDQFAETEEAAKALHNQEHRKRFAPEPVLESCVELEIKPAFGTQEEIARAPA